MEVKGGIEEETLSKIRDGLADADAGRGRGEGRRRLLDEPGAIRELVVGSYVLMYRVVEPGGLVEILAVVHGARRRKGR